VVVVIGGGGGGGGGEREGGRIEREGRRKIDMKYSIINIKQKSSRSMTEGGERGAGATPAASSSNSSSSSSSSSSSILIIIVPPLTPSLFSAVLR